MCLRDPVVFRLYPNAECSLEAIFLRKQCLSKQHLGPPEPPNLTYHSVDVQPLPRPPKRTALLFPTGSMLHLNTNGNWGILGKAQCVITHRGRESTMHVTAMTGLPREKSLHTLREEGKLSNTTA